jgi:hypothetical protein
MVRKRQMVLFEVILVTSAWVLGFAFQAGAETLKCQTSGNAVKMERMAIPDIEGHTINMEMRDGLTFFADGEVAILKSFATWDGIEGRGGWAQGYSLFTFIDGSTIFISFNQLREADAYGRFAYYCKNTGEILQGTGRFEGIKGSLSGTGKQFKPEKGELTGKATSDWTFTYTLPPK